jgi:hypothetical protein
MYLLEIEALDLGDDVRSVGLDLVEADENREPVRGVDAARIWARVLPATAGEEIWVLDFFSHIDRVRDFCDLHHIAYREANQRSIVVPSPEDAALESLLMRFESETFGVRAGGPLGLGSEGDPVLEGELARIGLEAYHTAFPNYFFCGICGFEDGSLVLLSEKISSSEVIRRMRPVLKGLDVQVPLPA